MGEQGEYAINLNERFGFLKLMDVPALIAACTDKWCNQTLCRVNDCVVRLGIVHGEFHWHKHDEEDELFFVLEGELLVDLETETVALGVHQGYTIPKGVVHRTRAPRRTAILMVEGATVRPTGDE